MSTITTDNQALSEFEQEIAAKVAAQLQTANDWMTRGADQDPPAAPTDAPSADGPHVPAGEGEPTGPAPVADAPTGTATDAAEPDPAASAATQPTTGNPAPAAPTNDLPTAEELARLRALHDWATRLDPQVAQQFALIENGTALAVPTDEFAAYRAWAAQNRPNATAGNLQSATHQPSVDLSDLDPDARAYVEQLQAQQAAAQAELESLRQQQIAARVPDYNAAVDEATARIDAAMVAYGQRHGFDDTQLGQLMNLAVESGAFGLFSERQTIFTPTGQVAAPPDLAKVTEMALEFARANRPDLMPSPQSPQSPSVPVASSAAPTAEGPTPVAPSVPDPVSRKRANAASLAAAPSAATQPPVVPAGSTPQDQRTAIAEFLKANVPGLS